MIIHIAVFGKKTPSKTQEGFCCSPHPEISTELSASFLWMDFFLGSLSYLKNRGKLKQNVFWFLFFGFCFFFLEVTGEQNVIAAPTSATSVPGLTVFLLQVLPPSLPMFARS